MVDPWKAHGEADQEAGMEREISSVPSYVPEHTIGASSTKKTVDWTST